MTEAPGHPGIAPRWTSADKSGVGTALSPLSRVWFTLSHGILNEIYYPRVDQACTRDLGLVVTDGHGFFAEEKRDCTFEVSTQEDGVPAYALRNTHTGGRFRIHKRVITDPRRDVVLQQIRLEDLSRAGDLRAYALLAPHLVNGGANNTAWLGDYKGQEMLFAEGHSTSLALAASTPFGARTVGYVGASDGFRDLARNFRLTETHDSAPDGNVGMIAELGTHGDEPMVLALGFGRSWAEAAFRARASLMDDFEELYREYAGGWRAWQNTLRPLDGAVGTRNTYRVSTAVIRTHESPSFPGGLIASLSIPWGASKGDDDLGGYHLVWPRDLVQTAGGLLACGATAEAKRVLDYLRAVQEPEGNWPQNSWLDGTPYWHGLQLDETAFPILLVDLAWRNGALTRPEVDCYWPMIRRAAQFLVHHGPITGQDRWEENAGYSVYTLAVEISALLVAAEFAERGGFAAMAGFLRDTADSWNASLEDWTYAAGTALARDARVDGYYVRIAPARADGEAEAALDGPLQVKNRADGLRRADEIVSIDALALVRFGLRAADDPRILNTIRVIDRLLRTELPAGPCWHRYNEDGYGEHADGTPFDGTGIGRLWPLLTGERAHYELAAGRVAEARRLLATVEACSSRGGMLPEQVWDTQDIPERELFFGRPSGSAMPLVWAHSEHVKLLRSLADGAPFDTPSLTTRRYVIGQAPNRVQPWRPDWRLHAMRAGLRLRIDLPVAATVVWTDDNWATTNSTPAEANELGLFSAELPTEAVPAGGALVFTWRLPDGGWAGADHHVGVIAPRNGARGA